MAGIIIHGGGEGAAADIAGSTLQGMSQGMRAGLEIRTRLEEEQRRAEAFDMAKSQAELKKQERANLQRFQAAGMKKDSMVPHPSVNLTQSQRKIYPSLSPEAQAQMDENLATERKAFDRQQASGQMSQQIATAQAGLGLYSADGDMSPLAEQAIEKANEALAKLQAGEATIGETVTSVYAALDAAGQAQQELRDIRGFNETASKKILEAQTDSKTGDWVLPTPESERLTAIFKQSSLPPDKGGISRAAAAGLMKLNIAETDAIAEVFGGNAIEMDREMRQRQADRARFDALQGEGGGSPAATPGPTSSLPYGAPAPESPEETAPVFTEGYKLPTIFEPVAVRPGGRASASRTPMKVSDKSVEQGLALSRALRGVVLGIVDREEFGAMLEKLAPGDPQGQAALAKIAQEHVNQFQEVKKNSEQSKSIGGALLSYGEAAMEAEHQAKGQDEAKSAEAKRLQKEKEAIAQDVRKSIGGDVAPKTSIDAKAEEEKLRALGLLDEAPEERPKKKAAKKKAAKKTLSEEEKEKRRKAAAAKKRRKAAADRRERRNNDGPR